MIQCPFCADTVPDTEAAISAHWVPSYWDEHKAEEIFSPVCLPCQVFQPLARDEHGTYLPVALTVAD